MVRGGGGGAAAVAAAASPVAIAAKSKVTPRDVAFSTRARRGYVGGEDARSKAGPQSILRERRMASGQTEEVRSRPNTVLMAQGGRKADGAGTTKQSSGSRHMHQQDRRQTEAGQGRRGNGMQGMGLWQGAYEAPSKRGACVRGCAGRRASGCVKSPKRARANKIRP